MKYTTPRGMRDFSPLEMTRRNYIFNIIKTTFTKYGFQQIETPAMEYLNTLLGKYGVEGDKLIFKVLNSGDFFKDIPDELIQNKEINKIASLICEKGLRYDLTVPFARYIVEHYNDLIFPFKRFQIQPVWRADRPQKGRYREFYQCDADIVGSDSLINELELLQIIDDVFNKLNINIKILINNRKILTGIIEYINFKENSNNVIIAIDKFEKIGKTKVQQELESIGLHPSRINKLFEILDYNGNNSSKLKFLFKIFKENNIEIGIKGVEELETLVNYINKLDDNLKNKIFFDLKLARGLDYYTGTILEVKTTDIEIGSICAGGRYDNLTGIFGKPGLSGVGISFGADRIYDVMEKCNLFPDFIETSLQILFLNFGNEEAIHSIKLLRKLREIGIPSEIYPDAVKIKKQLTYANQKNIKFVAIVGSEEIEKNIIKLKNMDTGEHIDIPEKDFLSTIKALLSK